MKKYKLIHLFSLLLFAIAFTACSDDSPSRVNMEEPSITEIAAANSQFSTLTGALEATGLDAALDGDGEFTVFAPTDEAFATLPEGTLESLTVEQLEAILLYHVLGAEVLSGQLESEQTVETLGGENIFITAGNAGVTINATASVVTPDIEARNGVIHAIDNVILPDAYGTIVDNVVKRYFLSSLVDGVLQAELAEALSGEGPFTVFAPTNSAFAAIAGVASDLTVKELTDVLLYHVVQGEVLSSDLQASQEVPTLNGNSILVEVSDSGASVNGSASITTVDIRGVNGVIHIVDQVLLPPSE